MADELLKQAQDIFEGQIDFEGQKTTELLSTVLLSISGLVAFIIGYTYQNIHYTLYSGLLGALITFLIVVPPYPWYNTQPENWLPGGGIASAIGGVRVEGKKLR